MALYVAGEVLTATKLNRHLATCQVHDATQTLTDNTLTIITFDSDEQLDTHGWHANGTNPTRTTPTINGWYRVFVKSQLVTPVTTVARMHARVLKNGTLIDGAQADLAPVSGLSGVHTVTATSPLVSMNGTTDYFEMQALQDDTGAASNAVETWMTTELVYPI